MNALKAITHHAFVPAVVALSLQSYAHADNKPADSVSKNDLHLIQSQVIFRHGKRYPVHKHHAINTNSGWEEKEYMSPLTTVQMKNNQVS
jgi:hypothetical protein